MLQVSLVVKIEVEACSYRALFTSVPCNSTLDVNKNSPRVLILQVSLVVKIEVEACSYRARLQVCLVTVLWM